MDQESGNVSLSVFNVFARRLSFGAFEEMQERRGRREQNVRDELRLFLRLDGFHPPGFHPAVIHQHHQPQNFLDVRLPGFVQLSIFSAQIVHLAVKESILPKKLEIPFDQIQRMNELSALAREPESISLAAHEFENLADDFFFVAKVKVKISWTDVQFFRDVIGRHRDHTAFIEQLDAAQDDLLFRFHSNHFCSKEAPEKTRKEGFFS
jgi:hypothetical protein